MANGKKELSLTTKKMEKLINWKKDSVFKGFQRIGSKIYLIRKNSICELKLIDELQYTLDYYSED